MSDPVAIMWFRQDLRLADNPALSRAARNGSVLPIYILDDENAASQAMGAASRWWLHHALDKLNSDLHGALRFYRGRADDILPRLIDTHGASLVCWNRCYEPWRIARDKDIKTALVNDGVVVDSDNGSLLWEPWEVLKKDGTPYRVFTPFYRRGCLGAAPPRKPLPAPQSMKLVDARDAMAVPLDDLELLPEIRWDRPLEPHWTIGEDGARRQLDAFLSDGLSNYKEGRNFPARENVSRLSPHLHWGAISPHQVWHAAATMEPSADLDHFRSELGWREFSHALLYHFPDLPTANLQSSFDRFAWRSDPDRLRCWQRGQTGVPIVDAGMRELWQTGYMHNRVRMIVGSFLVKNLLLHWRDGARWFWDCLVDADLANNSASWQWIAGCGADAAPFFRIFNPVLQGKKFDPDGRYTRRFVPELANMPDAHLFSPWGAPEDVRETAGVQLGTTYPRPIVDLRRSREDALSAYRQINQS
ncbi:MAG: DNA photolyase family protein [Alphaproteobacteria bacterium]|nr:DNA photolyase family protein [Alphaproteobacteria bacterium]